MAESPGAKPRPSFAADEIKLDALEPFFDALEERDLDALERLLGDAHPADAARFLEALPGAQRDVVWPLINDQVRAEVFAEAEDSVLAPHVARMAATELADIANDLEEDDAADLLQNLPDDLSEEVLAAMDADYEARLRAILVYPEDTAGGLMSLDALALRADITVAAAVRFLRRRGEMPERTNRLFIVERGGIYVASVRVADLLISDPEALVSAHARHDLPVIVPTLPDRDVALLFEQRGLLSAPVVDEHGVLLGRITVDDAVDVMREEADRALLGRAGLDEDEDLFAPVVRTSYRRAVWLGINLLTALLAAAVIGQFEDTISRVVALAVLMPVVASMGGIAGSQTLTLVVRGMALGQVSARNRRALVSREALVALLNGLLWATVVGAIAWFWFDDPRLAQVAAAAIVVNLLAGAVAGATVPIALVRIGVDPALAGGVVLTTVTDVIGFATLLGLGALALGG